MLTSNEDPGIAENTGILFVIPRGGGAPSAALKDAVKQQVTVVFPNTLTFQFDNYTPAQEASAAVVLRALVARYSWSRAVCAYGHVDFDPDNREDPRAGVVADRVAPRPRSGLRRRGAGVVYHQHRRIRRFVMDTPTFAWKLFELFSPAALAGLTWLSVKAAPSSASSRSGRRHPRHRLPPPRLRRRERRDQRWLVRRLARRPARQLQAHRGRARRRDRRHRAGRRGRLTSRSVASGVPASSMPSGADRTNWARLAGPILPGRVMSHTTPAVGSRSPQTY